MDFAACGKLFSTLFGVSYLPAMIISAIVIVLYTTLGGFLAASMTGRPVETVASTKDVGAVGAAMLVAVGSGLIKDLSEAGKLIKPEGRYEPNAENKVLYDKNYEVFKNLYAANKKNFAALN